MFGKKDVIGKIETIIAEGAKIKGDIQSEGTIRVDGEISGHISKATGVIIGRTGKVDGDLRAESAMIGGEISGNVVVEKHLELLSTARVLGDIKAEKLSIQEGAVFQGKCAMTHHDAGVPSDKSQ